MPNCLLYFRKEDFNLEIKPSYKIPYTLDPKFGDVKTKLKMDDGRGIDHAFTVRGLLVSMTAVMVYIYLVFKSHFSDFFLEGGIFGNILFALGYFGVIYFGLRAISIPGLYGYNILAPLMRYLRRMKDHEVHTESFQLYHGASVFTGMIEPDDQGYLHFRDGSYGQLFKIIGTASNNAFGVDRKRTILSYDNFLRVLPKGATISFITNTGGQNVERQLKHLFDELDTETDQNMLNYIAEEIRELGGYVQNNFVALHQFMLIRSDDKVALKNAVNSIQQFVEQDPSTITVMQHPTPQETVKFFKPLYSGLTHYVNKRLEEFEKKDNYKKSELETAGSLTNVSKPHVKQPSRMKTSLAAKQRMRVHVKR